MSRDETVAAALERLFSTYPQFGRSDDPAERVKAAAVYFEAIAIYETRDIEAAIVNLLNGTAPGVNPNFAPPAPALASEVRRVMNLRLDHEARMYAPRGSLPSPTVERTPESMARVKALMNQAVVGLASELRTPDAEEARRKQSFQSRMFDRFDPPQTERDVRRRLGFTVVDSDEDGDMGMMGAA